MSATGIAATPAPRPWAIALALGVLYVVWGSTYLAIRIALEGYPPFLLGAIRMLLAGALMYAVLRWRGVPAPTRPQWRRLWWLSIFMVLLSNGLVNVAEREVSSGMAAVAVASMPLWAALFALARGERPGRVEWIGLAVGFAGVLWLNAGGTLAATPTGMIMLLVAPIAWAWGSIWSRGRDLPTPFMSAAGQMLTGGIWMLAAALVTGERMTAWPSLQASLALFYLVGFGSIVGFTAYIWLLHHVRPVLATSYAYVNPPIAVLFGVLLAGEVISANEIAATAVILAGVAVITLARSRPRPSR
ncbi:MAG: drug/metabolite exporter YedA [Chiayiivirga sp.]|uniref:Drug/metabolite exporter YedA n=1 Tax=Denitratimonas tolerans TaxID=1338420 RepID=A0AAW9R9B4_9GAMM|nr:drug/metabolite exporter YedA [Chiayiivirga sp.]